MSYNQLCDDLDVFAAIAKALCYTNDIARNDDGDVEAITTRDMLVKQLQTHYEMIVGGIAN